MKSMMMCGAAAMALAAMTATAPASAQAPTATTPVSTNVLLAEFTGPFDGVPQWDKVTPAAFDEAFTVAIDEQRREIAAITANPAPPTFANTIVPYQKAGEKLGRVETYFGLMTSNVTTPAYQELDKEWSPKLAAAYDEIRFDPELFARIKAVYDARATAGLDAKQQRLVTRIYEGFVRNGAALDPARKAQLGQYNQQLASLFSTFSEKVLADESSYIFATEAELAGVPADVKSAAKI